jgi:hypothetical protein
VALLEQNAVLTRQVAWFKRQLFGHKSEHRLLSPDIRQLALDGFAPTHQEPADAPPPLTETVKAYQRRVQGMAAAAGEECDLRFDACLRRTKARSKAWIVAKGRLASPSLSRGHNRSAGWSSGVQGGRNAKWRPRGQSSLESVQKI